MERLVKQQEYIDSLRSKADFKEVCIFNSKIITYEENGFLMLLIFEGYNDYPDVKHKYGNPEYRQNYIDNYINRREMDNLIRHVCGGTYCENCD